MKLMKMILFVAAIMILAITYFGNSQSSGTMSVTPKKAIAMLSRDSSIVVLDVRTPDEYRSDTGHLPNALLIPVQELESRSAELENVKGRTILVYCRSGHRSLRAAEILSKRGFKTINLEGGILQWQRDSLEVVRER
jgi:rhodanese-related sulfurtransferase